MSAFRTLVALSVLAATASAYAPAGRPLAARSAVAARQALSMAEYKYPSSETLGIGAKVSSNVYAISSLACLGTGTTLAGISNNFNTLEETSPLLILGAFLSIYSFFLHVACYVQQKNGK